MAHIQHKYTGLWKPQDLTVDKISSQRMFVDNIDALESFALSTLKKSGTPVTSVEALRAIDTSDTTLYTDGMTIMVKSNGLYFFDRSSTAIDDGKIIIAPTVGGGRWISDISFLGAIALKDSLSATDVGLGNVPNVSTNDQTPTFTKASTFTNLISGEKLSTLMGKIMRGIDELISHINNKANPHTVTKTQVGLGNVDNTSDMDKPVSTAQSNSIADAKKSGTDAQANINSHISNKDNPHAVTKTQVGLGNVPNVSTDDQTPTFVRSSSLSTLVSGEKLSVLFGKLDRGIADLITHIAHRSNPHGVTKAQVGLGNVDNTSDLDKPVSTAVQAALDGKASVYGGEIPTVSYLRLTGFSILDNVDLNTKTWSGQYGVMSSCANKPTTAYSYGMLEVVMYSSDWLMQRYYTMDNTGVLAGVWYRTRYAGGTWTPWVRYSMGTAMAMATVDDTEYIENGVMTYGDTIDITSNDMATFANNDTIVINDGSDTITVD